MAGKPKYVTIKEREYQIGKFGAMDGAFIATKVGGILAPMAAPLLKGLDPKKISKPSQIDLGSLDIPAIIAPLGNLSEKDFSYLQHKSLSVCKIKLPVGYVDVLNDNGSFAIADLEDDAATVMALMVHTLMHNLAGFFDGSPLSGLLGGILATSTPN